MTNQNLLQQAEHLLVNYYRAEKIHYTNKEIKNNIRDWYENTEITNAYDLATISMVSYNKNIPYDEIKIYIENNRNKITSSNIISPATRRTAKKDLQIALLWWFIVFNAGIQALITLGIFAMGYAAFGYIISQHFNLSAVWIATGSFLLAFGHAVFLIFLRDKYEQLIERERNE